MRTCDDRSRSNRFGCTLPYGHLRWHAAHDLNGDIVQAWAPLNPLPSGGVGERLSDNQKTWGGVRRD